MDSPNNFGEEFKVVVWDAATTITYLLGVLFVERGLRPAFGSSGVPILPNIIMIVGELTLLFTLATRLSSATDKFYVNFVQSSIAQAIRLRLSKENHGQEDEED